MFWLVFESQKAIVHFLFYFCQSTFCSGFGSDEEGGRPRSRKHTVEKQWQAGQSEILKALNESVYSKVDLSKSAIRSVVHFNNDTGSPTGVLCPPHLIDESAKSDLLVT